MGMLTLVLLLGGSSSIRSAVLGDAELAVAMTLES